jgi:8-oxo-dGTP diphosphatase
MSGSLIPCVGAVIKDERGRLLLIKRGHDPGAGLWSLPGGRVEPGETDAEALVREMREETGLVVQAGRLLGSVRRPYRDGDVIDIRDYAATVIGGTLNAGDDAADTRWVDEEDLASLPITEGLAEILTSWGVLRSARLLIAQQVRVQVSDTPDRSGLSRWGRSGLLFDQPVGENGRVHAGQSTTAASEPPPLVRDISRRTLRIRNMKP